jgi:predicted ATPase with chaperone activity
MKTSQAANPELNPAAQFVPPQPQSVEGLDVSPGFLADLALKVLSLDSDATTQRVAEKLYLGKLVTEPILQQLAREKFIETKGVVSLHNQRYAMLDRGWEKVQRLMDVCSYAGAAPVSLKAYTDAMVQQVRHRPPATRTAVEQAMAGLVLSEPTKMVLGLVASSGQSLYLSGPSGNGKTAMASALINALAGNVWIPYAIEVDSQIIRVFDRLVHQPVKPGTDDYDHRWILIRPPLIIVGSELTVESLDLTCTDTQRFYEAPVQVKSNGGVLVVDDLGRQHCSARELLNRWIIPLEKRVDCLTLATGKKIQVPFEQIVIFATNLTSSELADQAFQRRMGYRLFVSPPSHEIYLEILRKYAAGCGLTVTDKIVEYLDARYKIDKRIPRACEPRDLVERVLDLCRLRSEPLRLSTDLLDIAWQSYFGISD